MVNRIFSDTDLRNRLSKLPCLSMVAFSASCAERLLPAYARYAKQIGLDVETAELYGRAMDMVWSRLHGQPGNGKELDELVRRCTGKIPEEEMTLQAGEPYASDAAVAVTFSLKALQSCDSQEAVWAARRVYDAVDNFVAVSSQNESPLSFDENQLLSHSLVQFELERQEFDLRLLEEQKNGENWDDVSMRMRQKARHDAQILFVAAG